MIFDKKKFLRSIGTYHLTLFVIVALTLSFFYNYVIEGILFFIVFYFILDVLEFGLKMKNDLFISLLIVSTLFITWVFFKPGFVFLLFVLVKTCVYQSMARVKQNFYHTFFVYFLTVTHFVFLGSLWLYTYSVIFIPILPQMAFVYHVIIFLLGFLVIMPIVRFLEAFFLLQANNSYDVKAAAYPVSTVLPPLHTIKQNSIAYGLAFGLILLVAGTIIAGGLGLTTSIKVISNTKPASYISPTFVPSDKSLYLFNYDDVILKQKNDVYLAYSNRYSDLYEKLRGTPYLEFHSFDKTMKAYLDGSLFEDARAIINSRVAITSELQYVSDTLEIIFEEMNSIYANEKFGRQFPDLTQDMESHLRSLESRVNQLYPRVEAKLKSNIASDYPIRAKQGRSTFETSINKIYGRTNLYDFKQNLLSDSITHGLTWKSRNEIKSLIDSAKSASSLKEKILLYNIALFQLSKEYMSTCNIDECFDFMSEIAIHPDICKYSRDRAKCGSMFSGRNWEYCSKTDEFANTNIRKCQ